MARYQRSEQPTPVGTIIGVVVALLLVLAVMVFMGALLFPYCAYSIARMIRHVNRLAHQYRQLCKL